MIVFFVVRFKKGIFLLVSAPLAVVATDIPGFF